MKKNLVLLLVLVAISVTAWLIYSRNTATTLADEPLSDFAISDTSAVTRIVITDHLGQRADLKRQNGQKLWKLNDKYYAREDAVNLLLKTFNRIRVRGNVSEGGRDTYMKLLATSAKKVEIYTDGNKPDKIYYVGVATPDHTGTIMLLEIPGIGRSNEPYITHMEGFTGFLSTRFFAEENEWRYTGVFEYPSLDFSEVRVLHHFEPQESFAVDYNGGNDIRVNQVDPVTGAETPVAVFDTIAVKELLIGFRKVHIETFNTGLKPEAIDSLNRVSPAYSIEVTERNGSKKRVDLFLKKAVKEIYDAEGKLHPWDVDHLWARMPGGEYALAQTFNFGPLLFPLSRYRTPQNAAQPS